jgi:16S rRNA (uracil1498-N3)-methyltransferase
LTAVRLYVEGPLQSGRLTLPAAAARHAQVRRVQPGDGLCLFDGSGSEWPARVETMGRSEVVVLLGAAQAVDRELHVSVTLAVGMPANERMDSLVEKATELGVTCVQPLLCERSVLRLAGERAERKQAHWQGIALAASEQSGRTKVPRIEPVRQVLPWLATLSAQPPGGQRLLLSLDSQAVPLRTLPCLDTVALSGPEGGLSPAEQEAARATGFVVTGLGQRVLRADTAPLALLAWLSLHG